jgi:hypothetical protein
MCDYLFALFCMMKEKDNVVSQKARLEAAMAPASIAVVM